MPDAFVTGPPASPFSAAGARFGRYAAQAALAGRDALEYLRTQSLGAMRRDAETQIQERPVAALLVGVGAGYLVGKWIRR